MATALAPANSTSFATLDRLKRLEAEERWIEQETIPIRLSDVGIDCNFLV